MQRLDLNEHGFLFRGHDSEFPIPAFIIEALLNARIVERVSEEARVSKLILLTLSA